MCSAVLADARFSCLYMLSVAEFSPTDTYGIARERIFVSDLLANGDYLDFATDTGSTLTFRVTYMTLNLAPAPGLVVLANGRLGPLGWAGCLQRI